MRPLPPRRRRRRPPPSPSASASVSLSVLSGPPPVARAAVRSVCSASGASTLAGAALAAGAAAGGGRPAAARRGGGVGRLEEQAEPGGGGRCGRLQLALGCGAGHLGGGLVVRGRLGGGRYGGRDLGGGVGGDVRQGLVRLLVHQVSGGLGRPRRRARRRPSWPTSGGRASRPCGARAWRPARGCPRRGRPRPGPRWRRSRRAPRSCRPPQAPGRPCVTAVGVVVGGRGARGGGLARGPLAGGLLGRCLLGSGGGAPVRGAGVGTRAVRAVRGGLAAGRWRPAASPVGPVVVNRSVVSSLEAIWLLPSSTGRDHTWARRAPIARMVRGCVVSSLGASETEVVLLHLGRLAP